MLICFTSTNLFTFSGEVTEGFGSDIQSKENTFWLHVVWNTLPPDLRSPLNSRRQFRSKLKTHLFRQAYNTAWFLWQQFVEECNSVTVTVNCNCNRLATILDFANIWQPRLAPALTPSKLIQYVLNYICTKFHACRQTCTTLPIRACTSLLDST